MRFRDGLLSGAPVVSGKLRSGDMILVSGALVRLLPKWTSPKVPCDSGSNDRMELQKRCCGVAGASGEFARVRSLGDAEQQADQQVAP